MGSANRETVSEGWPVCLAVASGDVASGAETMEIGEREWAEGEIGWVGGERTNRETVSEGGRGMLKCNMHVGYF